MPILSYTVGPELKALGIRASIGAEIRGLTIQPRHPDLDDIRKAVAAEVVARAAAEIERSPLLRSYRDLVRDAGRSLKRFPPAAEGLIRQVERTGGFPTINTAVDSYNVVVARRLLALGVHDLAKIGPVIRFRLSEGGEPFVAVGSQVVRTTQKGDIVYADDARVLAWFDSKDSEEVKVSLDTTDLVIIIQGTPATTREYNAAAAEEACDLITRFCGGSYEIFPID